MMWVCETCKVSLAAGDDFEDHFLARHSECYHLGWHTVGARKVFSSGLRGVTDFYEGHPMEVVGLLGMTPEDVTPICNCERGKVYGVKAETKEPTYFLCAACKVYKKAESKGVRAFLRAHKSCGDPQCLSDNAGGKYDAIIVSRDRCPPRGYTSCTDDGLMELALLASEEEE